MRYIIVSHCKEYAKGHDRQLTGAFLRELDETVEKIILMACNTWNGTSKKVDPACIPTRYRRKIT